VKTVEIIDIDREWNNSQFQPPLSRHPGEAQGFESLGVFCVAHQLF
jgi:hypothetical protein